MVSIDPDIVSIIGKRIRNINQTEGDGWEITNLDLRNLDPKGYATIVTRTTERKEPLFRIEYMFTDASAFPEHEIIEHLENMETVVLCFDGTSTSEIAARNKGKDLLAKASRLPKRQDPELLVFRYDKNKDLHAGPPLRWSNLHWYTPMERCHLLLSRPDSKRIFLPYYITLKMSGGIGPAGPSPYTPYFCHYSSWKDSSPNGAPVRTSPWHLFLSSLHPEICPWPLVRHHYLGCARTFSSPSRRVLRRASGPHHSTHRKRTLLLACRVLRHFLMGVRAMIK